MTCQLSLRFDQYVCCEVFLISMIVGYKMQCVFISNTILILKEIENGQVDLSVINYSMFYETIFFYIASEGTYTFETFMANILKY